MTLRLTDRPPCWYGAPAEKKAKTLPIYWSSQRQRLINNCPYCFYLKYIKKLPENPFEAREKKSRYGYGSVAHLAVEAALTGKRAPDFADIAADAGIQHIETLEYHIKMLRPKLKALNYGDASSEKALLCQIWNPENPDEQLPLYLYGFLDLSKIMSVKGEKNMMMADVKSGAAPWSINKCRSDYQFRGYAYFGWAFTGKIPQFDVFSLVKPNGKKGADVRSTPVDFTFAEICQWYRETKESWETVQRIQKGEFPQPKGVPHFFCEYPKIDPHLHGKA